MGYVCNTKYFRGQPNPSDSQHLPYKYVPISYAVLLYLELGIIQDDQAHIYRMHWSMYSFKELVRLVEVVQT